MSKEIPKVQDQIPGAWKQVRGEVRQEWGRLTEDDLEQIKGERTILVGKIRQRYGVAIEEANLQIDEWSDGRRI